jgi:hypothetical protein
VRPRFSHLSKRQVTTVTLQLGAHTAKLDIIMFAQARSTLHEPEPGPTHLAWFRVGSGVYKGTPSAQRNAVALVRYSGLALTTVVQGSAADARNLSPTGSTPSPQSKMARHEAPVDPERSSLSDTPCSVRSATVTYTS